MTDHPAPSKEEEFEAIIRELGADDLDLVYRTAKILTLVEDGEDGENDAG